MDCKIRVGSALISEGKKAVVTSQIDGSPLGSYVLLDPEGLDAVIKKLKESFIYTRSTQPKEREILLRDIAGALAKNADTLIDLLIRETGKPFALAKAEADAAFTSRDSVFHIAASEALRNTGIIEPLFVPIGSLQRMLSNKRYPIGPILSSVHSFNPLSLAAHEIGASIASGATMLLRPPEGAALTLMEFSRIVSDVLGDSIWFVAAPMTDELFFEALSGGEFGVLSYFGDTKRARELRRISCGIKSVIRAHTGASAIVESDSDLKRAVDHIARGAFANAGRMNFSIKSAYIHTAVYDEFIDMFMEKTQAITTNIDPFDENSIYPNLPANHLNAEYCEWRNSTKCRFLNVNRIGDLNGATLMPVIIETSLCESFGDYPINFPLCFINKYETLDDAVESLCRNGLGSLVILFSREQGDGLHILKTADIGTLVMNEYSYEMEPSVLYSSLFRFGGGNSGIRFAIEEYTEQRALLYNNWWGG